MFQFTHRVTPLASSCASRPPRESSDYGHLLWGRIGRACWGAQLSGWAACSQCTGGSEESVLVMLRCFDKYAPATAGQKAWAELRWGDMMARQLNLIHHHWLMEKKRKMGYCSWKGAIGKSLELCSHSSLWTHWAGLNQSLRRYRCPEGCPL